MGASNWNQLESRDAGWPNLLRACVIQTWRIMLIKRLWCGSYFVSKCMNVSVCLCVCFFEEGFTAGSASVCFCEISCKRVPCKTVTRLMWCFSLSPNNLIHFGCTPQLFGNWHHFWTSTKTCFHPPQWICRRLKQSCGSWLPLWFTGISELHRGSTDTGMSKCTVAMLAVPLKITKEVFLATVGGLSCFLSVWTLHCYCRCCNA